MAKVVLHQAVRDHVDAEPRIDFATLGPVRSRQVVRDQIDRNFERFGLQGPRICTMTEHLVPAGDHKVRVVLHRPRPGRLGVVLQIHGGGWMHGSPGQPLSHAEAAHRAHGADVVVAAVEYRLAPEHPFPAGLDDVATVLHWLRSDGERHDLDPDSISVIGNSAGANLGAAAVLAAPDVPLRGLVLEVPALDLTGETVRAGMADDPVLDGVDMAGLEFPLRHYLPDPDAAHSPFASPLLAPSLGHFPPTLIHTAQLDPLKYDGSAFAERLRAAGVPVSLQCFEGALHGSPILTRTWGPATRWQQEVTAALAVMHSARVPVGDGESVASPHTMSARSLADDHGEGRSSD